MVSNSVATMRELLVVSFLQFPAAHQKSCQLNGARNPNPTLFRKQKWGFPKIRDTILGVPYQMLTKLMFAKLLLAT